MRFYIFSGSMAVAALSLGMLSGAAQANDTIGQLTGQTPRGASDVTFTSSGNGGTLITNGAGARVSAVGPIEDGSFNDTFNSYFILDGAGISQVAGSAVTDATGKTTAQFGGGSFSIINRNGVDCSCPAFLAVSIFPV